MRVDVFIISIGGYGPPMRNCASELKAGATGDL